MSTFAAMVESLIVASDTDKSVRYETLMPQLHALIDSSAHATANVGNIMSALKQTFDWWWVGVYLVRDNALELGPFQGPVACTRIAHGKGVCGSAWAQTNTIIVPDVDLFPGHIACSAHTRSEIVIPIWKGQTVIGVLDVDSQFENNFDSLDQHYLEAIALLIATCYG